MPTIQNTLLIGAPLDTVYSIARDVERFPDFMPDVQRITVLEASPDGRRQVVEWVGLIPSFRLTVKWTEEDTWDDVERTCHFRQVKGDFTEYGGSWRFVADGEGTRFESEVRYELEIPTIGPLIRGVVRKIMTDNVDRLQAAIKKRAEAGAAT
ncbi:MAG TPA: SRPBCC family protein [Armatimonadota bacterium]|nr:SRPBCC family protein [Armatimonadota bacterium]